MTVRRAESEGEFLGLCGSPVGIRKTLKTDWTAKGALSVRIPATSSRDTSSRESNNSPRTLVLAAICSETLPVRRCSALDLTLQIGGKERKRVQRLP